MARNQKRSNHYPKKRKNNYNNKSTYKKESYKKDELMDKVDLAFEESSSNNKFSIADEDYFTEEIDRSLLVKEDEFYSSHENPLPKDEDTYFQEMEKIYGSKLKKDSEVVDVEVPIISEEEVEVTIPEDAPPIDEDVPQRSQEEYFAEMEKIYGSRLDKTQEVEDHVEEERPMDTSFLDDVEEVEETDMAKKTVEEEKENDIDNFDTDIMSKIGDDLEADIRAYQYGTYDRDEHSSHKKHKPNPFMVVVSLITFICAIVYFVYALINSSSSILSIVNSSILLVFTILFTVICITSRKKNILMRMIGCFLLLGFFIVNLIHPVETVSITGSKVQDFRGKTLMDVVKWANDNKIKVTQDYEFSDMVEEYSIISQDVEPGTSVKDIDTIAVAVSEGPNPYKEIIVPSMLTWDSERVINYVLSNHLSNVIIEFVESDQVKDTVIEQSKSGNLKRNDELRLVFSYGDEGNSSDVTLIDFTDMTQFEIEFYMKQHRLNYNIIYDFSSKIKKGYGLEQSITPGTVVRVQGDKIQVTISKGPKIVIPDFAGMSVEEITEWAIENKLKLEFVDQYDDSVKYGKIIKIDQEKDAVVEEGTVLKVTLSLGGLKMPKFKNVDDFYTWADKYGIKYETKHEFSDSVEAGEVIEYSYKEGQTIKNGEVIVVTISDGKKVSVPNLKGLTKSQATKKLKDAGLNYNFVYKTNDAAKDTVISQSISSGSQVSSGTTITVTLSSGKSGSNNDNPSTPSPSPSVSPSPKPSPSTPTCTPCTVSRLTKVWSEVGEGNMNYNTIANALIKEIEGQCPGIDVQVRGESSDSVPGSFIRGFNGGDTDENGNPLTSCSVVHIYLAK